MKDLMVVIKKLQPVLRNMSVLNLLRGLLKRMSIGTKWLSIFKRAKLTTTPKITDVLRVPLILLTGLALKRFSSSWTENISADRENKL